MIKNYRLTDIFFCKLGASTSTGLAVGYAEGPIIARSTGSKTSPCQTPIWCRNIVYTTYSAMLTNEARHKLTRTTRRNILKKEENT